MWSWGLGKCVGRFPGSQVIGEVCMASGVRFWALGMSVGGYVSNACSSAHDSCQYMCTRAGGVGGDNRRRV